MQSTDWNWAKSYGKKWWVYSTIVECAISLQWFYFGFLVRATMFSLWILFAICIKSIFAIKSVSFFAKIALLFNFVLNRILFTYNISIILYSLLPNIAFHRGEVKGKFIVFLLDYFLKNSISAGFSYSVDFSTTHHQRSKLRLMFVWR